MEVVQSVGRRVLVLVVMVEGWSGVGVLFLGMLGAAQGGGPGQARVPRPGKGDSAVCSSPFELKALTQDELQFLGIIVTLQCFAPV